MSHEGGCSCGRIRFRLEARPIVTHCCHCRQCQRVTGSAFVLNAIVETGKVKLLCGEPIKIRFAGTTHTAWFCGHCGTYVYSAYDGRFGGCRFVRVGVLDDPDAFPPDVHIFTASKQPWVVLPGGVPSFPESYELEEVLPQSSLRRLAATLG